MLSSCVTNSARALTDCSPFPRPYLGHGSRSCRGSFTQSAPCDMSSRSCPKAQREAGFSSDGIFHSTPKMFPDSNHRLRLQERLGHDYATLLFLSLRLAGKAECVSALPTFPAKQDCCCSQSCPYSLSVSPSPSPCSRPCWLISLDISTTLCSWAWN